MYPTVVPPVGIDYQNLASGLRKTMSGDVGFSASGCLKELNHRDSNAQDKCTRI